MTVQKAGSDSSRGERSSHELKRTGSESSEHLENIGVASPVTISDDGICENESPQNPRNWPHWKKNAQILMVAFHSMMGTFMAAGIVPAYDAFAEEYNVTVPAASYLTSFQVRTDAQPTRAIYNTLANHTETPFRSCSSVYPPSYGTLSLLYMADTTSPCFQCLEACFATSVVHDAHRTAPKWPPEYSRLF